MQQHWMFSWIAILLFFLSPRGTHSNDASTFERPDRIVGGRPANPGEFPYQVSLQSQFNHEFFHFCGGSLVKDDVVVTAAHCILKWPVYVYAGSNTGFLPPEENHRIKVSSSIKADYDRDTKENDIAVLKLSRPLKLSKAINQTVDVVKLPPDGFQPQGYCTVTGWGETEYGKPNMTKELLSTDVEIVDHEQCREKYVDGVELYDTMLCAGAPGRDTCQGDSGGPLVCTGKDGERYLSGVTSWGYRCADPDYPGVYTDVTKYKTWIEKAIRMLQCSSEAT